VDLITVINSYLSTKYELQNPTILGNKINNH